LLLVLVATTVLQHVVSGPTRTHLLDGSSTDVGHLTRDPLLVLLASAFWLSDLRSLVLLPAIVAVLYVGERRFGTWRTVAVFALGHVIATLLTELSVLFAVHLGWLTSAHEHRLDVGPSYGTSAVLGLLVATAAPGPRRVAVGGLTLLLGIPLVLDTEMSTFGHLIAALVGASTAIAVRRWPTGGARLRVPYRRGYSSESRC
jgi:hypothetical protein